FEGDGADVAVQPERVAALAFGSRWPEQWGQKADCSDFYDIKQDLQRLAANRQLLYRSFNYSACHPGRCAAVELGGKAIGWIGELHPRLQQKYELDQPAVMFEMLVEPLLEGDFPHFQGLSRMPVVRRDYAFTVAETLPAAAVLEAVRARVPGFVREVELFDLYRGKGVEPGKKSLALRIVMQDTDRTLTDSEVEVVMASIRELLAQQFQARPRT